jgi:hypothetical protein
MNINELYKRKQLFAARNVGNEKILVPLKNNIANMSEIFNLNEVGSFVWDMIDGKNTEAEIVSAISNEFDVDEQTAKSDMDTFIKKFEHIIK